MGYDTFYSMEIEPAESEKQVIDCITSHFPSGGDLDWLAKESFRSAESRWYDHDADMKRLSSLLPGITLTLGGHGEDDTDQWTKTYRCGELVNHDYLLDLWSSDKIKMDAEREELLGALEELLFCTNGDGFPAAVKAQSRAREVVARMRCAAP